MLNNPFHLSMEPEFTYYAFISYSHRDEKFARKLHRFLDRFKLPTVLCRRFPHLPKAMRPVFLDSEEMEINGLSEAIKEALAASRYLIVICSENSLKPNEKGINWIDWEIRTFLKLNPENASRLIPIVLRRKGDPDPHECLLPVIQELDILGADVLTKGTRRVFIDVVAKMAGLKSRVLRDHLRRGRLLAGAVAALLAALAGWGSWYYFAPHVSYFSDYIERNNIPEGIGELNDSQMQQRHRHYRITTKRLMVSKVEYCNSAGVLQDHLEPWHKERSARIEIEHDKWGRIAVHYNSKGKKLFVRELHDASIDFAQKVLTGAGTEDHVAQQPPLVTTLLQDTSDGSQSTIARFLLQREQNGGNKGLVVRELFCESRSHAPARDAQGVGGRQYTLDEQGRPVEVRYLTVLSPSCLNARVELMETPHGISGYRLSYQNGRISRITFINKEGKPTPNEQGWAEARFKVDTMGNILQKSCHAADGALCLHPNGYARVTWSYDPRGNKKHDATFGTDGKPCPDRDGIARIEWWYTEKGNREQEAYFDLNNNPCRHRNGYARATWEYDSQGRELKGACFDENGHPCTHADGNSSVRWSYDEQGNKQTETYYDTKEHPCRINKGYAAIHWEYNGLGKMTQERYVDEHGHPCQHQKGYASKNWTYDSRGNKIREEYRGTDGQPCESTDGISHKEWVYDSQGNLTHYTARNLAGAIVESMAEVNERSK